MNMVAPWNRPGLTNMQRYLVLRSFGLSFAGGVDDITLNPGTGGVVLATDDIGGRHHQIIKLAYGPLDTGTLVTASVGLPTDPLDRAARDLGKVDVALLDQYTPIDVDTGAGVENALPITIRVPASGGSIPETYGAGAVAAGTKRVTLASDDPAVASLAILDNIVAGSEAQVDVITVPAPLNVVGGGVEATALRVTLANDSTGVLSVDDNGGALTVDNAGTFAVQVDGNALTALQLIDDIVHSGDAVLSKYAVMGAVLDDTSPATVTENQAQSLRMTSARALHVSVRDAIPAGDSNIGNVDVLTVPAPLSTTGTGTEATALRVTIATDSTGVLSVDDNGASLTVDNAALAVVGNGAAATALRVTLANDSTGIVALTTSTASIGKLAANSGVDIGDVDILSIAAGANLIGNVGIGVRTAGGCTIFRSLDLDETEEEVKATAGQVYGFYFHNAATTARYLKFYNATAATVVVGTTTPVLTLPLPFASSGGVAGWISLAPGIPFGTAITVAVTTGLADNDTGAPGANDVQINILYA